jgi:hypothetical protein
MPPAQRVRSSVKDSDNVHQEPAHDQSHHQRDCSALHYMLLPLLLRLRVQNPAEQERRANQNHHQNSHSAAI